MLPLLLEVVAAEGGWHAGCHYLALLSVHPPPFLHPHLQPE
jgi:hypothetical protein